MRKIFSVFMLVAAAAMAFVSCQKEGMGALEETFSTTLTLNTDVEQTKTYLGENNTILWGKAESVILSVKPTGVEPKFITSTATDVHDGLASAAFTFALNDIATADSYTLGGVYPASAAKGITNENETAYKIALPATQNASVDNYDPAAFIMVLKPETVQTVPSTYTASFRRAVALNKITLTNVKEEISSVEITVPQGKYLAGRRFIDLSTGKSGEIYENGGRTNTVKVNAEYAAGSVDVWFTSWGVELAEGEKLTIKMTSESKTYTRVVEARAEGIKFVEGSLNTLTVNMSSAEEEILDDLSGEYLIAAVPQAWNLMSGTNGGKYYSHVASNAKTTAASVKCSDFYAVANIEECVWTVAKVDNGYSIKNNKTGKYVSYSGSSNEAYASSTAAAFALTQDAGVTTVESVAVPGRKLKYNASSPRFAFYTTEQTALYFIPWVADSTPRIFVDKTVYDVEAAQGSVDVTYSINSFVVGSVTAAVKAGATMTVSSVTVGDGKVTVNYEANTAEESKTATVVLSCNGAESKEVVINQAAAQTSGNTDPVTVSKNISDISGTPSDGTKVSTMKLDDVITASASTSGNNGKVYSSGAQWRLYQSDKGTITISAKTGYSIKTVKFTYTVSNSGVLKKDSTNLTSGTTDTVNASTNTYPFDI